jgi:ribonuclease P protein component
MGGSVGLPPRARLRSAAEFKTLRLAPGRLETRHFLFRYAASPELQSRLGLAVSRRVSKKAVQRNRIKRLVRESFRHSRTRMPPLDVLVIPRAHASKVMSEALRADLERAWPRLQALNPVAAPGTMLD